MEDANTKEENKPSTSKKESQRTNSGNDLYDERGHDDRPSNSDSTMSATYSVRSRVDITDARPEVPKTNVGKREVKAPERKKKGIRAGGRVEKRRRSFTRRQVRRAPLKGKSRVRKMGRRERELSVSTIFTRLSSRSGSRTPGCIYCGHRCCRRRAQWFVVRFQNKKRRYKIRRYKYRKQPKQKIVRAKKLRKKAGFKLLKRQLSADLSRDTKETQMGSRSQMLSPLFLCTNSTPEEELVMPPQTYSPVTPEMIFDALRNLTLWKQDVPTIMLSEYILRHFPVNPIESELLVEIRQKLGIAVIVGMALQKSDDCWSLTCELLQRQPTVNHVTLFWKVYADTLSAIPKQDVILQQEIPGKDPITTQYKERGAVVEDDIV